MFVLFMNLTCLRAWPIKCLYLWLRCIDIWAGCWSRKSREHVGQWPYLDQTLLNQMNWWISKPTSDPKLPTQVVCRWFCRELVFLTNWWLDHKQELTERPIISSHWDSSLNELSQNLFRVDYVDGPYQPWWRWQMVVTRGGANTIFETLTMKLHPHQNYCREASRGDQIENAVLWLC